MTLPRVLVCFVLCLCVITYESLIPLLLYPFFFLLLPRIMYLIVNFSLSLSVYTVAEKID